MAEKVQEFEVWKEVLRTNNGTYVSGMPMIVPKDVVVRSRQDEKTNDTVLEYLM